VGGCSVYSDYGYGRIARSKLDAESMTEIELPANAPSISQRFRPVGVSTEIEHKGFDILVRSSTPVLTAAAGKVSRVQTSILYGRQVMVDHGMVAEGYRIQTRYFHLSEQKVKPGDQLQRGQLIGYSGASGMAGVYPHLHFEVHRLGEGENPVAIHFLDPQIFWVNGAGRVTCYDKQRDWGPSPVALTYPVPCWNMDWSE
jgi:murein DD-endopeptidase MepM/ murein hydrolase activator NlpD